LNSDLTSSKLFPTRRSSDLAFQDGEQRSLVRVAEDRESGDLAVMVDGVVAPFARGHAAAVHIQYPAQLMPAEIDAAALLAIVGQDRKSTRLNSSHVKISYAV